MESRDDIVLVSAVRTPFSKFDSPMKDIPSIKLGEMVIREVMNRVGLQPEEIDEVNYGSCLPAEFALETDVPGRQATLLAGFPGESISLSLDRACCSSLTAMRLGIRGIKAGELKIVMAVGSENMPRCPHLAPGMRWAARLGHLKLIDPLFYLGYDAMGFNTIAVDAGEVALEYGITREMQDEWAMRSHKLAAKAYAEGKIKVGEELMPVEIPRKKGEPLVIDKDECIRENTTMEALAKLKTVYGSPTITAGNAPPISAGSSALIVMTRQEAEKRGLEPLATIVASVCAAAEPRYICTIPAESIEKALAHTGLAIDDMDLIEINEAFAAMPLVSTKILAQDNAGKWDKLKERTNVNGGAIALGHPVGSSAARITMTLAHELKRRGGGYGAAAICGGLAQGEAVILKV
ncbi:MAG TPA: thiolase family protein [Deltaproteobacteria bacterium]|nr:thiolase family protein [Deltaproteobacteria bacterium]